VLKAKLAVNTPNLSTAGGFWYEEGEGLEEDEAAASRALLPRALAALPGGGLVHGSILSVGDQGQAVDFEVIISHQVRVDHRGDESLSFGYKQMVAGWLPFGSCMWVPWYR